MLNDLLRRQRLPTFTNPLMRAALSADLAALKLLADDESDIGRTIEGSSALIAAARSQSDSRIRVIQWLAARGADLNATDVAGDTALHHACYLGDNDVLALLLTLHANTEIVNNDQHTPLAAAAAMAHWSIVETLAKSGAQVNPDRGMPPIHAAASVQKDDPTGIELLQRYEADMNARGKLGRTALMGAAMCGNADVADALLKRGAKINARDDFGNTALMEAARCGANSALERLVFWHPETEHRDKPGRTALLVAVASKRADQETIRLLLAMGADPRVENREGRHAAELATANGRYKIARALGVQSGLASVPDAGPAPAQLQTPKPDSEVPPWVSGGSEPVSQPGASLVHGKPSDTAEPASVEPAAVEPVAVESVSDKLPATERTSEQVTAELPIAESLNQTADPAEPKPESEPESVSGRGPEPVKLQQVETSQRTPAKFEASEPKSQTSQLSSWSSTSKDKPAESDKPRVLQQVETIVEAQAQRAEERPAPAPTASNVTPIGKRRDRAKQTGPASATASAATLDRKLTLVETTQADTEPHQLDQESKTGQEAEAEPKSQTKAGPQQEPELAPEQPPTPEAEAAPASGLEIEPEPATDPEPEAESAPKPEPKSELIPEPRPELETPPDLPVAEHEPEREQWHEQLLAAARDDATERMQQLLEQHSTPEQPVLGQAYIEALRAGHQSAPLWLLDNGLEANTAPRDPDSDPGGNEGSDDKQAADSLFAWTLRLAPGQTDLIETLLKHGAQADFSPSPLLWLAGRHDHARANEKQDQRLTQLIDKLVERGADINDRDQRERSPLHLSVSFRSPAFVQALLEHNALVNAQDSQHNTALLLACRSDGPQRLGIIRQLIKHGADPHLANRAGESPMSMTLKDGDQSLLKMLMMADQNTEPVEPPNNEDLGAQLITAAADGNLGRVKRLLGRNVNINARDANGCTALLRATGASHPTIVSALLAAQANPEVPSNNGMTPLGVAVLGNQREIVRLMLDRGVAVDQPQQLGITPLMLAAAQWNTRMVGLLLRHGADVNARDESGGTALMAAAQNALLQSDTEAAATTLRNLLEAGADVNAANDEGQNVLLLLLGVRAEDVKQADIGTLCRLARQLIDAGVEIDHQDMAGWSCLHACAAHGLTDPARELLNAGANRRARDINGLLATDLASERQHRSLVELFRSFA